MVRRISAKVEQGIFLVFLHLRALGNGCRESFDARHVKYQLATDIGFPNKYIGADIEARQCPTGRDGEQTIRGGMASGVASGEK